MEFSKDDLKEAKRQIDSTLHKLRETIKTFEATPHNSTCRYGERGVPAAKQKAQIILCVLSSIFATQMVRRSRRSGA